MFPSVRSDLFPRSKKKEQILVHFAFCACEDGRAALVIGAVDPVALVAHGLQGGTRQHQEVGVILRQSIISQSAPS